MRKCLVGVLALTAALVTVGIAQAVSIQTITGNVTSSKLPRPGSSGKPVGIFVEVTTTDAANPANRPPAARLALLDLPSELKFKLNKPFKGCPSSEAVSPKTVAQVIADCKGEDPKSLLGIGRATVRTNLQTISAEVAAFDSTVRNQVILYTHNTTTSGTPLIGTLVGGPGGQYGKTLAVNVPALAGGQASIVQLNFAVKKKIDRKVIRRNGTTIIKRTPYIRGTCGDGTLSFQARFTYVDNTQATGSSSQACTKAGK